jgi:hypothetical protein
MNKKHIYNQLLKNFSPKNPVVFTFHINWKTYEILHLKQFNYIKNLFAANGINTIEFLPILTDKKTYMENRLKQFKQGLERIVDKHERKAHVIGYSFAGVLPRGYISLFNGDEYISSLLTIGTPHKGSKFVQRLNSHDFTQKWFQVEPGLRAAGLNKEWLMEEFSPKTMNDTNNIFISSPNVKYNSVGGRRLKINCSESIRFIAEENANTTEDFPNDGLVGTHEAEFGTHLINFDADHFELIGMRPNFHSEALFEFYSNCIKNNDEDFVKLISNEIGVDELSKFNLENEGTQKNQSLNQ